MTALSAQRLKLLRRVGGGFLAITALWYVSAALVKNYHALAPLLGSDPLVWASGAAIAPVYAASLLLLGWGWVLFLTPAPTASRDLLFVYTATSAGKYFPGGFLHFGGRQALGAQRGFSQAALLKASIGETLASAGAALVIGAVLYWAPGAAHAVAIIVLFGVAAAVLAQTVARKARHAILAGLLAGFFMLVMAAAAMMSATLIGMGAARVSIGGAYLLAWCAGFVAPGVSAGIGVREAALLLLLAGRAGPAEAMALAVLMRFITTLGDGLFFLGSFALKPAEGGKVNN